MWLRNYYTLLNSVFGSYTEVNIPGTNPSNEPALAVRNTSGNWIKAAGQTDMEVAYDNTGSDSKYKFLKGLLIPGKYQVGLAQNAGNFPGALCFGSGNTPATYDDYRLDTPITSGFDYNLKQAVLDERTSYDSNTDTYSFKTKATYLYSGSSPITVREIGIGVYNYPGTNSGSAVLLYREVLSTPLEFEAGDSVIIEFNFNIPRFKGAGQS